MKRKVYVALGIILVLLISFIYVTASGISQLSNEKILYLFLDETKGDPGTVEVASLAIYENARLTQSLIKVNPLDSTDALKREGISILDSLIKAKTLQEGIQNAQIIAEHHTNITIDRVVLIDASAFKLIIDATHPIFIDKSFRVDVLDKTFNFHTKTTVTGVQAESCIRGKKYPGIENAEVMHIPEDYLWEVKAEIINDVANKVLDLDTYSKEEQKGLVTVLLEQYKKDTLYVYKRTTVLTLVYYLPGFISKQIINFAVRLIR